MAKIRMNQTIAGGMDGIHARKYLAGQEYEIDGEQINNYLAKIFLNANVADIVRERKPSVEPSERAVIEKAPEIKTEKPQLSVSDALEKADSDPQDENEFEGGEFEEIEFEYDANEITEAELDQIEWEDFEETTLQFDSDFELGDDDLKIDFEFQPDETDEPEIEENVTQDPSVIEAKTTRVYELAQELRLTDTDIVNAAAAIGINATTPQSGLTDNDIQRIRLTFEK